MRDERKLHIAVLLCDLVLLTVSGSVCYWLTDICHAEWIGHFGWMPFTALSVSAFTLVFLLYPSVTQRRNAQSEHVVQHALLTGVFYLLLLALLCILVRPNVRFPRMFIMSFSALFTVLLAAERLVMRWLFNKISARERFHTRVALVGATDELRQLMAAVDRVAAGYEVTAVFYDKTELTQPDERYEALRRGSRTDIYDFLAQHDDIHELFAFYPEGQENEVNLISKYCDNHLIRLYFVPQFRAFHGNFTVHHVADIPIIARREEPLCDPRNILLKRAFDLVASSLFLATVYPFIYVWVALMIKRQSPGPVFFKQERTGIDGHVFECLKFRSMHVNDQADQLQATRDDPRKFPFGDFMRRTNIDELPQLVNVWKGEMSLVGPRPHMLKHTEEYSRIINRFMVRHFVRPGITGLAQVSGFRGETRHIDQMEGRVRKDIEYIENWTFFLDIKILVKTITNMLGGEKEAY